MLLLSFCLESNLVSQLYQLEPTFFSAIAVVLGLLLAGRALTLACSICSIRPPSYWQAINALIVIGAANVCWYYGYDLYHTQVGLITHLLVPMLITVVLLAISLSTDLCSALLVASVQVCLCGLMYLFLNLLGGYLPG